MNATPHSDDGIAAPDGSASAVGAHSPWPRIVLVLGVVLIVAASAVAALALWSREPPGPVNVVAADPTTSTPSTPSPTPVAGADLSPAELARQFGDAVWQVQAEGCGYVSTGTAFVVGPRTLVTNAHVIDVDATPSVISRDGGRSLSAVVAGADADLDVAVLVADADLRVEPLSWTDARGLSEGQDLVALGFPVPDHSFTVTPATVMSFQSDGPVRQALRLDGLIDKGNSGGPALTTTGQVAGVVTSLLNSGYQWIGMAYTHEYLADAIRTIERDQPGFQVECTEPPSPPTLPDDWEWDWDTEPDWDDSRPDGYGDDPDLDRLYEACRDGDMAACDDLFWQSPYGSDYESFASTCGGAQLESTWSSCSWTEDDWDPDEWDEALWDYGDDPDLDALWDECSAGDMDSCDTLYLDAPVGSAYEGFGGSCGGYFEDSWAGFCADAAE